VSKPYEALLVPERALATDQNIKFVYVVGDDNTATRRTIKLGDQRSDMRIVTEGLKSGERVIVKGLQRVKPGQKVEAELAETAPAKIDTQSVGQVPPAAANSIDSALSKSEPRSTTKER
jgi:multidrug efflux system membrane fusion protein